MALLYTLLSNGRSAKYYSTGYSRINWDLYIEDWAALFKILEDRDIEPDIAARFPILDASEANELMESGKVLETWYGYRLSSYDREGCDSISPA